MMAEREPSSLDDETPGSQGEIESGSEGDFGDPASPPPNDRDADDSEQAGADPEVLSRLPAP